MPVIPIIKSINETENGKTIEYFKSIYPTFKEIIRGVEFGEGMAYVYPHPLNKVLVYETPGDIKVNELLSDLEKHLNQPI